MNTTNNFDLVLAEKVLSTVAIPTEKKVEIVCVYRYEDHCFIPVPPRTHASNDYYNGNKGCITTVKFKEYFVNLPELLKYDPCALEVYNGHLQAQEANCKVGNIVTQAKALANNENLITNILNEKNNQNKDRNIWAH